jgi:hypothetical protein
MIEQASIKENVENVRDDPLDEVRVDDLATLVHHAGYAESLALLDLYLQVACTIRFLLVTTGLKGRREQAGQVIVPCQQMLQKAWPQREMLASSAVISSPQIRQSPSIGSSECSSNTTPYGTEGGGTTL